MSEDKLMVAKIIAQQLGKSALFMLGAQNLVGDEKSLQFKIRGSDKFSHIKIELTSMDDYEVTFYKCVKYEITNEEKVCGVYCDQLHQTIERYTGLATSLNS